MDQITKVLDSIRQRIDEVGENPTEQKLRKVDPAWEAVKDYVDSLPSNYIALVKKNGIRGKESLSGKLSRTKFELGKYKGMDLELIEYTKADNSIYKVWYAIFNDQKNLCYVRYIHE